MNHPQHAKLADYQNVRGEIADGDVLLFRPLRPGILGRLITRIGRGPYSHAELAVWCHGRLLSCGALRWHGVRAATLSGLVEDHDCQWDVFRVVPRRDGDYDRGLAVDYMLGILGQGYGWYDLLRTAAARMCLARLLIPPDIDDRRASTHPSFCRQAVSRSLNAGGIDPVHFRAHRATGPNDLARSTCLKYLFTLT